MNAASPIEPAPGHPEIVRVLAPNPGPMTLEGTNTYIVGSDPAWVIDPGPDDASHLNAMRTEADRRGGIGGILITHAHLDHTEAVGSLEADGAELLWGATVPPVDEGEALAAAIAGSAGGEVEPVGTQRPGPTARAGPFDVIPTPGHATDHVAFALGDVCFCGDLILGAGSSIVPPKAAGGSLADYLASLDRLDAAEPPWTLLAPGHGPWITDPAARIATYRAHRLQREQRLIEALDAGERSRARLLELVWDDVPAPLRPAAALAMQAHLEKLAADGVALDGLDE